MEPSRKSPGRGRKNLSATMPHKSVASADNRKPDPMSEATETVLPEAALSETEFLHRQAEQAQLAIGQALANARAALAEGMDPREWTKKYPLVAVGSALVAGFAASVMT